MKISVLQVIRSKDVKYNFSKTPHPDFVNLCLPILSSLVVDSICSLVKLKRTPAIQCPPEVPYVPSRDTRIFALMRSRSSAVVARGDGCSFLCVRASDQRVLKYTVVIENLSGDCRLKVVTLGNDGKYGKKTYVVEPGNALLAGPSFWI